MTWLEDGLQARKKQYLQEVRERDTLRWLREADEAIVEEVNAEDTMVRGIRVSSVPRNKVLAVLINASTLGQYIAGAERVEFKPVADEAEKNHPTITLNSEDAFRKHLEDLLWQVYKSTLKTG